MPNIPPHIADAASAIGLVVSLIGFVLTLWGVWRSKRAAQGAQEAARHTRDSIAGMQTIVDLTSAVATLEEVKRRHRDGGWQGLPDQYSVLRRKLVALRSARPDLTADQQKLLQGTISQVGELENFIERAIASSKEPSVPRLNKIVSQQSDKLTELLTQLQREGVS